MSSSGIEMYRDWENAFRNWAQPPSMTEQVKCEHAESVIRNAIGSYNDLSAFSVRVFTQGSYRNHTNVRTDSDVDICAVCADAFFYDLPDGMSAADFGITPSTYSYRQYKNDVEAALIAYLGHRAVTRGNKAFEVHENTYRVDSDVVACFEYRWYQVDASYYEGTAFLTDSGKRIFNYPEQNYQNGVAKNDQTSRRFKPVVRILKCLRNEMADNGDRWATDIPSYLIECLVWNVPNDGFGHYSYSDDVRYTVAYLYNETLNFQSCKDWVEINGIKYLFHSSQPWNFTKVNPFLRSAWDYIGFR